MVIPVFNEQDNLVALIEELEGVLKSLGRTFEVICVGDPRVNIQNKRGRARAYHVRQVLKAIERLELEHDTEE